MARCPKCHCGELVEIGRRMVCLNCDYTCSRSHARLLQNGNHSHSKVSYAREVQLPQTSPQRYISGYASKPASHKGIPGVSGKPSPKGTEKKTKPVSAFIFVLIWILALLYFYYLMEN